jgi:hypothetical protein
MGKGDQIFAGSHGKTRPKYKKEVFISPPAEEKEKPVKKPRKPVITKAKASEPAEG